MRPLRSFASSDVDEVRVYLGNVLWPHDLQTACRSEVMAFRHRHAQFSEGISVSELSYGAAVRNSGQPDDDCFMLILTTSGTLQISGGGHVSRSHAGDVCIMNPTTPFTSLLSSDSRQLAIKMDGRLIRRCIERETGASMFAPVSFESQAFDAGTRAPGLVELCQLLWNEASRQPREGHLPSLFSHLEEAMASLVVGRIPHNHSKALTAEVGCSPALIERARAFIEQHCADNITVAGVARHVGVSTRALQYGFKRHVAETPHAFITRMRLRKAETLLTGRYASGRTITEIAYDCGFASPSKFAAYYRRSFGTSPSSSRDI